MLMLVIVWTDNAKGKEQMCQEKSINEVHLRSKDRQGKVVPV